MRENADQNNSKYRHSLRSGRKSEHYHRHNFKHHIDSLETEKKGKLVSKEVFLTRKILHNTVLNLI